MKIPWFKDVRLPAGAIPSNWPLLVGLVLSVFVLVGLLITGEDVPLVVDPLDVGPADPGEVEAVDPRSLVGSDEIDAEAARRRAEAAELERRRRAEADRIRREASEEARARAAQLARAEEQLSALRARQMQSEQAPERETPMDLLRPDLRRGGPAGDVAPGGYRQAGRGAALADGGVLGPRDRGAAAPAAHAGGGRLAAAGLGGPAAGFRQPARGPGGCGLARSGEAGAAGLSAAVGGCRAACAAGPPGGGSFYDPDPAPPWSGQGGQPAGGGRVPAPGGPSGPGTFSAGPRADGGTGGVGPTGVVVTPNDGRDYRLYEGTMLPAVLQTQLDGTFSGPLSAQVTRHVYSADRQRVLVPRGTVALGVSEGVQDLWQGRLAIGFHRLIFPDGRWVRMEFAGMNGLGETSLRDQVNRHYLQMFGAAGAVGVLAGFAQAGGQGQFRSAASEQMANTSMQIVSQFLNRLPEVTIRAGHRVNIRLMEDLVVPAGAAWEVD